MNTPQVLILDCVSPHEIEDSLSTEGDILRSILANRNSDSGPKVLRIATAKTFRKLHVNGGSNVRFLHVTAHANKKVLGFVDGEVDWEEVAEKFKLITGKLKGDQRRVLCLSCCWSKYGAEKLAPLLAGFFTGIYHLNQDKVDFEQSITLWCMFFLKKHLDAPHHGKALRATINDFFDEKDSFLLFTPVKVTKRTQKGRA